MPHSLPAWVRKYLNEYAEPASLAAAERVLNPKLNAEDAPKGCGLKHVFDHCIVVPCYDETPSFATRLMASKLWSNNLLVIVVINQPDTLNNLTPKNHALFEFFSTFTLQAKTTHAHLYNATNTQNQQGHWLIINACTDLRPLVKQGVGLARKLGCDAAVALWANGHIKSPWLHSTDADALLPEDYFTLPEPNHSNASSNSNRRTGTNTISGAHYGFEHIPPNSPDASTALYKATKQYESAIQYFAKSLNWAGSPYSYTALGSALAIPFSSYCQVRGFPKKSGGEDFYLLNKLAKVGRLHAAPACIRIYARASSRVPFGTGPATSQIIKQEQEGKPYCYYNPKCFHALKAFLTLAPALAANLLAGTKDEQLLEPLAQPIQNALKAIGINSLLKHLRNNTKTQQQANTAIHDWFDAFRTLKFIHHLQNNHYPPLPLTECLAQAPYVENKKPEQHL